MKVTTLNIILIFLTIGSNCLCQTELIDQFGYSSQFCSGTYYLYSDSSFAYERGCEEQSSITIGNYKFHDDTLFLIPTRLKDIDIIKSVEYKNIDSTSYFKIKYASTNDSTIIAHAKYTSIDQADLWKLGKIASDSLEQFPKLEFDWECWCDKRLEEIPFEVCLMEIERLCGNRIYFSLSPEINEIIITLPFPYEILQKMINYEVKYEPMESGSYKTNGRLMKIEYH